jgi:hypothetical protein
VHHFSVWLAQGAGVPKHDVPDEAISQPCMYAQVRLPSSEYVEIELQERGVPVHVPVPSFDLTVAKDSSAQAAPEVDDEQAARAATRMRASAADDFIAVRCSHTRDPVETHERMTRAPPCGFDASSSPRRVLFCRPRCS